MKPFRSLFIAFSMYSAIPMPQVDWDREGMALPLCWFPFIGIPIGLALWGWHLLCQWLVLGRLLTAAGFTLLPVVITGGIHLDGFCDACDALASRQSPEKKLEIMKDPRTGAFGVMGVTGYLLLTCGVWDSFLFWWEGRSFGAVCLGFVLSRALSGLAVATFPLAKQSGLVYTFAATAHKKTVALTNGLLAVLAAGGMLALAPLPGTAWSAGGWGAPPGTWRDIFWSFVNWLFCWGSPWERRWKGDWDDPCYRRGGPGKTGLGPRPQRVHHGTGHLLPGGKGPYPPKPGGGGSGTAPGGEGPRRPSAGAAYKGICPLPGGGLRSGACCPGGPGLAGGSGPP